MTRPFLAGPAPQKKRVVHILDGLTSDGRVWLRCRRRPQLAYPQYWVGCARPASYHQVTCKKCLSRSAAPKSGDVSIPRRAL